MTTTRIMTVFEFNKLPFRAKLDRLVGTSPEMKNAVLCTRYELYPVFVTLDRVTCYCSELYNFRTKDILGITLLDEYTLSMYVKGIGEILFCMTNSADINEDDARPADPMEFILYNVDKDGQWFRINCERVYVDDNNILRYSSSIESVCRIHIEYDKDDFWQMFIDGDVACWDIVKAVPFIYSAYSSARSE